ncbi:MULTISPECIES: PEP-CTERM sorting domain-containing protein [unclassified Microcoleus]|uniref:PEP-CTERM sorting domain-containing protein n=1 Tax=unclassified Microcoleus TaxID=2642155 RepID=UPI0025F1BA6D|nr:MULTISPECIES: PEP-CTERM sorting domain-containing protein [unclassified Microcoleus]
MCTPLAKLAIGLSATMATGFYYLAAAPPASAAVDVCGPGNYSSACVPDNSLSPQSPTPVPVEVPTSPAPVRDAVPEALVDPAPAPIPIVQPVVPEVPVVQSPSPIIVESAVPEPPVASPPPSTPIPILPTPVIPPVIPPVSPSPSPVPPIPVPSPRLPNYINPPVIRRTTIPEPGTVVALLLTGAGIMCSARKRNKQVGQQR